MFGRRASGHLGFPKYWRNPGGEYNPENSISRACAHPERRVVTTDWTKVRDFQYVRMRAILTNVDIRLL